MGYWGIRSYSSYTCHSILGEHLLESNHPSVAGIEFVLTFTCFSRVSIYHPPQELYLGVVMWGLHHNVVVARRRLQHALRCAHYLLNDEKYLERWASLKARRKSLIEEVQQLKRWLDLSPKEFKIQKALGVI